MDFLLHGEIHGESRTTESHRFSDFLFARSVTN